MTAPVPAAFEDVVERVDSNVRKAQQGTILLGKHPIAPDVTTLAATGGQIAIPASYESVGWIGEEGLTFGMDQEVSEVPAWGSSSFIRRDIRRTDQTLAFMALETKRLTKELTTGLDLSATMMDPETGEVVITHPDRVRSQYWRVLALGVDGDGDGRYYLGKWFSKMSVTERDEEAWSDGDDPLAYGVTMGSLSDSAIGTPCREFLFGPGALAAAEAMGWDLAAVAP